MEGLFTIAQLTLLEARRRRVVLAALICGVVFLLVIAVAIYFINRTGIAPGPSALQQGIQRQVLTLAGLYVVNFLVVAMSVMLPVDTLSGEMASGVIQTLASKPIRRAEIVLGKWLVYWLLIGAYIAFLALGVVFVMRVITGFTQHHVLLALGLMWLEATVLLTVTVAGGVRFSTVTNGIVAFAFYALAYIGGWIETVGLMVSNATARYIGTAISLVSPPDALWRLAMHVLQPPVMSQVQFSPFSFGSVPSGAMVWWSVAFVIAMLALAIRGFQKRAL